MTTHSSYQIRSAAQEHADRARRHSYGFTLIEVAFAVLILSGTLVTLLGLQSSSIQRAVRDRNKQQAMLIARQIFSSIETASINASDKNSLEIGERTESPDKIANEILQNASNPANPLDPENRFLATLKVEYWDIKGLPENSVKRVSLTVSWSDNPLDKVSVIYFVPSEDQVSTP